MNWLKKVYLQLSLKLLHLMKKFPCLVMVKKGLSDEISEQEITTAETLCRIGFSYLEVINIVLADRQLTSLLRLMKEKYPNFSDDQINDLIDEVRSKIKKGETAKSIFKELQATVKNKLKI